MQASLRLISIVVASLSLIALTAASAAAQEVPAEVIDEASGLPCSPCSVELEGESHIVALPANVVVSRCHDAIEGFVNHDGTGDLTWAGTTRLSPGCNVINCIPDGESSWPISGFGESNPGVAHMTLRFCYRAPPIEAHCNGEVSIIESSPHVHRLTMTQLCLGGARRVEAQWNETGDGSHDAIEVVHPDE